MPARLFSDDMERHFIRVWNEVLEESQGKLRTRDEKLIIAWTAMRCPERQWPEVSLENCKHKLDSVKKKAKAAYEKVKVLTQSGRRVVHSADMEAAVLKWANFDLWNELFLEHPDLGPGGHSMNSSTASEYTKVEDSDPAHSAPAFAADIVLPGLPTALTADIAVPTFSAAATPGSAFTSLPHALAAGSAVDTCPLAVAVGPSVDTLLPDVAAGSSVANLLPARATDDAAVSTVTHHLRRRMDDHTVDSGRFDLSPCHDGSSDDEGLAGSLFAGARSSTPSAAAAPRAVFARACADCSHAECGVGRGREQHDHVDSELHIALAEYDYRARMRELRSEERRSREERTWREEMEVRRQRYEDERSRQRELHETRMEREREDREDRRERERRDHQSQLRRWEMETTAELLRRVGRDRQSE